MGDIVNFNVGGKVFTTTRETLVSDQDSLLAQMLDGRSTTAVRDENGAYFIDRDPDTFAAVLEFLRTGQVFMTSGNGAGGDPKRMSEASMFYQIPGLRDAAATTAITQLHALDEIVRTSHKILTEVRILTRNQGADQGTGKQRTDMT
jgi:hypothetical protein